MDLQQKNKFTINDYFTANYGLPERPAEAKLGITFKHVLLCLLVIGIFIIIFRVIKFNKQKALINDWDNDYAYRRDNWDAEYDKFYDKTVAEMNVKEKAMQKIGIDADEVTEAEPFSIHGKQYDGFYRFCKDDNVRTENCQITWLFFSKDQVYTYDITFSLIPGRKKPVEKTLEFFYTDIVSVSTGTVSTELKKANNKGAEQEDYNIEAQQFTLTVPGDKMRFAFTSTSEIDRSVQGMKNLIRARKTAK